MLRIFSRSNLHGEKATFGNRLSRVTLPGFLHYFTRFWQFVLGLVVIGLYAVDLDRARKAHKYTDGKWVWAVVCGTLGSLCALILAIPFKGWYLLFGLDILVFLCYIVAFGIFGKMYIHEDPEGNAGVQRMKNAVWVLLTNALLWFGTAVVGGWCFWRDRKARTSLTGRAGVHA